jgi:glucosamine--fructose-6-phosphate aminotransferase (isomerizing)
MLGAQLEREIREQPAVWRRLADAAAASELARTLRGRDVLLIGSGSSLFAGMLGALALRRRGIRAFALAATEARFDATAYRGAATIALSQSGRSRDVLDAIEMLRPDCLIALTNDGTAPLAERADVVIDIAAGREQAVPATKSVSGMCAVLLWGASLLGGQSERGPASLRQTADEVESWLASDGVAAVAQAADRIARCRSLIVAGAGYGVPIAYEVALKVKESSYLHAEGFAAGEFRHGSAAILDRDCALLGILDEASRPIVARPLEEARRVQSPRYVIGEGEGDVPRLGPLTGAAFNTLAWLVTGQILALEIGRARSIDSDAPRGLSKYLR